jgi:hypothetical protein
MIFNSPHKTKLVHKARSNSIIGIFVEEFQEIFIIENPTFEQIKLVFDWLKEEAKCAMYFSDINALNKCRRFAESNFSKLEYFKKMVWKESRIVNRELMKRFEELRTIRKSTKGRLPIFEGQREEVKALPSE